MTKTPDEREHGLDLLRASAILLVLFYHSADLPTPPEAIAEVLRFGWMGVDLFFVLSGFLIGRQVFATPAGVPATSKLRTFWIKRWFRTLPLYYVVLLAYFAKPFVFHVPFKGEAWRFLTFTQNFAPLTDFIPSWSLCVEEQFYLGFPIVAFVLLARQRVGAWFWLVPLVASVVFRYVVWAGAQPEGVTYETWGDKILWVTYTHLDGISVGVFLAATERSWSRWSAGARGLAAFGGLALWIGACALFGSYPARTLVGTLAMFPAISAGFGLLLVGLRRLVLPRPIYLVVKQIALWSYGAYLWHSLMVRSMDRLSAHLGSWPVLVACFFGATLGLACLTYWLVERPGLRLRDRVLRRASR